MVAADFEKLGVFYLGRKFDADRKQVTDDLLLYDSKDLTTHAICIGMTGSGKTGLCLGLVEEAAIDGLPVIAIDVKGDISNLLLSYPNLSASDLTPWVDARQAKQAGLSVADYAEQKVEQHLQGLHKSGQSLERIARLRASSEICLYTPGSSAGRSISLLGAFMVPPPAVTDDSDALRDRISTSVDSILVLLGIDADPLQSREHILLSNIVKTMWQQQKSVELTDLVHLIQNPPITRIGAIEVDSIFPPKERFSLAMKLNNLIASPGFEAWMQGDVLDIDSVLYDKNGSARTSIFYIAHLDDTERMFFVTLLLNRIVAWMREQTGTSSLRALLYMDEIFGYFPPVANPPAKRPLLTLLKQARAFGLGVVLATQNPVDIDYKGLSNAGTWFIGRLQTERDKTRVLDGLQAAASSSGASFDRQELDQIVSGLGNRTFLVNNVHDSEPYLLQTRWTLCYLAGPLTLQQIKSLKPGAVKASTEAKISEGDTSIQAAVVDEHPAPTKQKPLLPPEVPVCILPVRVDAIDGAKLIYRPQLLAVGNARFVDTKAAVDTTLQYCLLVTVEGDISGADFEKSQPAKVWIEDLVGQFKEGCDFEPVPAALMVSKNYPRWRKEFSTWLPGARTIKVYKCEATGHYSKPRESERDFRIRLNQVMREQRDAAVAALKAKWAPRLAALETRLLKAQHAVASQQAQADEQQFNTAVNLGATMFGAMVGRKSVSRASATARSLSRAAKEQNDVQQAKASFEMARQQAEELNSTFQTEVAGLESKFDPASCKLVESTISAKKTNITVPLMALAWAPYWRTAQGKDIKAWIPAGSPR